MAFPSIDDVKRRLEEDTTPQMDSMIQEGLRDALDLCQEYGNSTWDENTLPERIGRLCAKAVARWIRNPDGFAQSRAGDETLMWQDQERPGEVHFTEDEIAMIQRIAQPQQLSGFGTIQMLAYGDAPVNPEIRIPVMDGHRTMPWWGPTPPTGGVGLG